jgi:cytidylate kinase
LFYRKFKFFINKKKSIDYLYQLIDIEKISEVSSQLAAYPSIRTILLKEQRLLRRWPGLVAEGRDMGTVVFPNAILKFFLNASLEIRTKRRISQLHKYNYHVSFEELLIKMKNRDERDQNRLISPLCVPKNAIILDSTYMSISEITKTVMEYIIEKIKI